MIEYKVENLPDDLPPGEYAVSVTAAYWQGGKHVIELEFKGEIDPSNPTLFTITKHEDNTITNN